MMLDDLNQELLKPSQKLWWRRSTMTKQLSLFPENPLNLSDNLKDNTLADFETIFNPVDEMFAASTRFRDNRCLIELLRFIARFPGYSAFTGGAGDNRRQLHHRLLV